ncbi:monovalent cation/H(+) antiporter subunit G [Georgenia sp. SYP-B2076]|uniref:monovalent cation/H(+) antiporter subunit G n=1 Tax=Georgenia sp. SYP-B2076 TaxID=2495881 RepID=UPI000F8D4A72|nr:monovalent cation/H(+) antiporter subunit G [Georgenia sp. SYP-B2076]
MSWNHVADVLGAVCLVLGSTLTLVAAVSVNFFQDLLSRMHAATKPQVLGLALMMTGLALIVRNPVVGWTLVLVLAFQLITAPISAHMVGRAGYRTGKVDRSRLVVDELTEDLEASARQAAAEAPAAEAPAADAGRGSDGRGDGRRSGEDTSARR